MIMNESFDLKNKINNKKYDTFSFFLVCLPSFFGQDHALSICDLDFSSQSYCTFHDHIRNVRRACMQPIGTILDTNLQNKSFFHLLSSSHLESLFFHWFDLRMPSLKQLVFQLDPILVPLLSYPNGSKSNYYVIVFNTRCL